MVPIPVGKCTPMTSLDRHSYRSNPFMTRWQKEVSWQHHAPVALFRTKTCTCCTSGWTGLEVRLDDSANLDRTGIRSSEHPVYSVQGKEFFLLSKVYEISPAYTHRHTVCVPRASSPKERRSSCEAHLLPSSAEAKCRWIYASSSPCAFNACTRTVLPLPVVYNLYITSNVGSVRAVWRLGMLVIFQCSIFCLPVWYQKCKV